MDLAALMAEPLFSPNWYRVAELRPRLRSHAKIHRHRYRGRTWYVLQDAANQRFHRFGPAAHAVISLMDGERTLREIWEVSAERLGDDCPTQDETIRLLAQLHAADVLRGDQAPDSAELLERYQKKERKELQSRLLNPFAIRIPLVDPDRFLRWAAPAARPLFGPLGVALWLAVVLPALLLVGLHWTDLTEGFVDRVLAPGNLVLVWLTFPLVKALHELGHGFAARVNGAEVHDMGVMLLVFTPVPYAEVSSASAFPQKSRRMLVGAAGMIVEVFVAALALYVWLAAEPGVTRAVAYNAMLIGGVTTLAFNANPLLRFDGYYILADWLEIPNLRQRANGYVGYLVEHHAFGRREAEPPDATASERAWLLAYAVGAFLYRFVVIAAIVLFVFDLSVVLGVLLTAVAGIGWIGMPLAKGLRFLFADPRLRTQRRRAVGVTATAVVLLAALLLVVPFPLRTRAEGVVWVPEESLVRAESSGFVSRVVAEPGSHVEAGDVLVECADPELEAQVAVLAARLRGLDARTVQARHEDLAQAQLLDEERRHVRQRLADARERARDLVIRSPRSGTLVLPRAEDLPGRFVRKGTLLAHVVEEHEPQVRAVVSQDDIALVHHRLERVELRFAERISQVVDAEVRRVVPTAREELPSTALGTGGGGSVAVDPRDAEGRSAMEKHFELELALLDAVTIDRLGQRVHLRFHHGTEPLLVQGYRRLRQLFLSRLDV